MDDTNRCVCCGEIIPEGRQVCPTCEKEACVHVWLFDGMVIGNKGQRLIRWKCQRCGADRITDPDTRRIFPWR